MILVPLIMAVSLVGTVILIGVCAPLSAAAIPAAPPRAASPSVVIEEPFRGDRDVNAAREDGVSRESNGEDAIRAELREKIASSSVPILRARGMTDEEIKTELLRDFALTEEQVDEILAAR